MHGPWLQKPTLAFQRQDGICWDERLMYSYAAVQSAHLQWLEWFYQIPGTLQSVQTSQVEELCLTRLGTTHDMVFSIPYLTLFQLECQLPSPKGQHLLRLQSRMHYAQNYRLLEMSCIFRTASRRQDAASLRVVGF